MKLFDIKILAADHVFYQGNVQSVTIHTPIGGMQFLADHAQTIASIIPGDLKFVKEDGTTVEVVSGVGTLVFNDNTCDIIVDTCETQEQLDERRAREAYERAQEKMRQKHSIREYKMSQAAMARALARLQFKGKHLQ